MQVKFTVDTVGSMQRYFTVDDTNAQYFQLVYEKITEAKRSVEGTVTNMEENLKRTTGLF